MTTHTAEHSPTPWEAEKGLPRIISRDEDEDVAIVTAYGPRAEANVAHIVHCVNMYDELVWALEYLGQTLANYNKMADDEARIAEADEVLAKAKAGANGEYAR